MSPETDPPAGAAGLMLFPACHPGDPVRVFLTEGRMFLACGQCWKRIGEIAFVSERPPAPFDPEYRIRLESGP